MRLLADECTDTHLVDLLRADGFDVLYVMETMRGATDDTIPNRAYSEQRILLTEDKDFGELVFRLRKPATGIILLRFSPNEDAKKATRLRQLLQDSTITFAGAFVVVEIGSTAKVARNFAERGFHDRIATSYEGRSLHHENPTRILPPKADSVHLRTQCMPDMRGGVAGSLHEWDQDSARHERSVDDCTPSEILPGP